MKNSWIRAGVAIAAVGTLGIATAGPAMAEDSEKYNYAGLFGAGDGYTLNTPDGELVANTTGIYPEEDEAGEARTYRLDTTPVSDDPEIVYDKHPWADTSIGNLGRAKWIVDNSYPTIDAATVADKAGADLTGVADPDKAAYTATQAAIWVLTSELKLNPDDPTGENEAVDAAVLDITHYLINENERIAEPSDAFTVEGKAKWDGKLLGPFHFDGVDDEGWVMAHKVDSGHEAGKVVDEDGKKLTHLEPGQKFYVDPNKGIKKLVIGGIATDSPKAGTLMLPRYDKSQPTLILAEDAGYGVTTSRTVTVGGGSGSGGDDILPVTGMSLTGVMGIGAALLVGGALTLILLRRRATAEV